MTWRIPLADLTIGPEEEAAVLDVIRRRWLTMGEITHRFEAEFATFVGSRHALAVTNGTAALHLAWRGARLGPRRRGDCPSPHLRGHGQRRIGNRRATCVRRCHR